METQFSLQAKESFYLYKVLKIVWAHAGEIQQEISAHVLQLQVLALLLGSLQGAEHHSSQHQVEEHPGEDAEEGGAAHGCTSAQLKRRLLSLSDSLAVGVARIPAATETSANKKTRPQLVTSSGVDLCWPRQAFDVLLSAQTINTPPLWKATHAQPYLRYCRCLFRILLASGRRMESLEQ